MTDKISGNFTIINANEISDQHTTLHSEWGAVHPPSKFALKVPGDHDTGLGNSAILLDSSATGAAVSGTAGFFFGDEFATDSIGDNPFSVSCWINMHENVFATGSAGALTFRPVLTRGNWTNSSARQYILGFYAGGSGNQPQTSVYLFDESTNGFLLKGAHITPSEWYNQWKHIVWTYDGGAVHTGLKIYLSGTAVTLGNASGGTYRGMDSTDSNQVQGTLLAPSTLSSSITEVAIWNAELTAAEVATLYNNGNAPINPKLIQRDKLLSWYRCNSVAGDISDGTSTSTSTNKLYDRHGNQHGSPSAAMGGSAFGNPGPVTGSAAPAGGANEQQIPLKPKHGSFSLLSKGPQSLRQKNQPYTVSIG